MNDKTNASAKPGPQTQLIKAGYDPASQRGFINPPVVHGSTVLFPDAHTMETHGQKYTYGTRGTPTTDALCDAVNELEGRPARSLFLPDLPRSPCRCSPISLQEIMR